MRPALAASQPASTTSFIAPAMPTGAPPPAITGVSRTPPAPPRLRAELHAPRACQPIAVGLGETHDPPRTQPPRRVAQRDVVGEQGRRTADHPELHPSPAAELARQARRADRLVGGVAAGG